MKAKQCFITIYSDSEKFGINQIEAKFSCLAEYSNQLMQSNYFDILERNKGIECKYYYEIKEKYYKRMNKPFAHILKSNFRIIGKGLLTRL